jgi:hypothetical protein
MVLLVNSWWYEQFYSFSQHFLFAKFKLFLGEFVEINNPSFVICYDYTNSGIVEKSFKLLNVTYLLSAIHVYFSTGYLSLATFIA